nr:SH3 domain-containing protein [Ruegeria arenilitoris]
MSLDATFFRSTTNRLKSRQAVIANFSIKRLVPAVICILIVALSVSAANAQDRRGQVTNLPLPRYVSMKAAEGNVRRGPSLTHRIDWVFKRRGMPLQITAEYGNWRKVQDRDGAGGWVHYALLSGVRTVLIEPDLLPIYATPDPNSQVNAHFESGVVARLGSCTIDWCRISAGGYRGWTLKANLWGVEQSEVRE